MRAELDRVFGVPQSPSTGDRCSRFRVSC